MKVVLSLLFFVSLFSMNASANGHHGGYGHGGGHGGYYSGYRPYYPGYVVPVAPVYYNNGGYYNSGYAQQCVRGNFCGYNYYGQPTFQVVCTVASNYGWQTFVRGCY